MWLLGCVATCRVPFVIWSVQAAPVSASNTLLGSNKMLKATTEREARLSASERRGVTGTRRKDKKRELRGDQRQAGRKPNCWEEMWFQEPGPLRKTPKQWDSNCAIRLPELLNYWMFHVEKESINEKWSMLRLDRALQRCCMKPDLVSSQNITYHHLIPQP